MGHIIAVTHIGNTSPLQLTEVLLQRLQCGQNQAGMEHISETINDRNSSCLSEFYDRLVSLAIPRIRDFRGMSTTSFDGRGNYTFGVTEQLIFPEIDYDKIGTVRGMDITIVTTATTDDHGRALLQALGFPFRRDT